MKTKIRDMVVVITGASSGIGRATALAFAERGAAVVVAARREDALHDVVDQCQRLGGKALAVPMDVTDPQAHKDLAHQAIETFGHLDMWINNAGVSLFARFEEAPLTDFRRVLETNVFGYIYGARAALPVFRQQGHGTLINVASVVAATAQPYTSAYTVSKHAIRALGMSLRQELFIDEADDIHVCTVMPATIDTPIFQHAANYTGRKVQAMPPIYKPERVAKTILQMARNPKREVYVGPAGRMFALLTKVAPKVGERMMARQVEQDHLTDKPSGEHHGNLFNPMTETASITGGWREKENQGGNALPRTIAIAAALLLPAALAWYLLRERKQRTPLQRLIALVK